MNIADYSFMLIKNYLLTHTFHVGKNHHIDGCKFSIIYNNLNLLQAVLTAGGHFIFDKFVIKNGMCSILDMESFWQEDTEETPNHLTMGFQQDIYLASLNPFQFSFEA